MLQWGERDLKEVTGEFPLLHRHLDLQGGGCVHWTHPSVPTARVLGLSPARPAVSVASGTSLES